MFNQLTDDWILIFFLKEFFICAIIVTKDHVQRLIKWEKNTERNDMVKFTHEVMCKKLLLE